MTKLIDVVESLRVKVSRVIQKNQLLEQKNEALREALAKKKQEVALLETDLIQLKQKNATLKSANALLGSKEYKRETKLKINSLIKEIDDCIYHLSE